MNLVVHKGRLVADPEVKIFDDGSKVCNFRLAVRRDFKNRDGEYESDFFNYSVGGHSADFMENYGRKGRMVLVSGALRSRPYTDKDGNKRTDISVRVNNIEFEDSARDADGEGDVSSAPVPAPTRLSEPPADIVVEDDSALPF